MCIYKIVYIFGVITSDKFVFTHFGLIQKYIFGLMAYQPLIVI